TEVKSPTPPSVAATPIPQEVKPPNVPPTVPATPAAASVEAEVMPPISLESPETKVVASASTPVELVLPAEEGAIATSSQWQQVTDEAIKVLSDLPRYLSNFYRQNQRPLNITGAIVGSAIAIRLVVAIVEAVESVPLLAFTFELIGAGYSVWFVSRYLLRASERKELYDKIQAIKEEILGRDS
ncbi:MAG: hypothetical protein F6K35_43130, partial [Okeania sp. SIO2H7]|nr:hypothetical protein [Okeania sp. SIO2H7]